MSLKVKENLTKEVKTQVKVVSAVAAHQKNQKIPQKKRKKKRKIAIKSSSRTKIIKRRKSKRKKVSLKRSLGFMNRKIT